MAKDDGKRKKQSRKGRQTAQRRQYKKRKARSLFPRIVVEPTDSKAERARPKAGMPNKPNAGP